MIKREEVFAVIDEIVPEYERGAKVRHINSSFSRAYGESRLRNAQIDLTFVCRHNNCGVTYVEIRFNDLSG